MLSHKHEDLDVLGYFAKKVQNLILCRLVVPYKPTYVHRHVMNRYYRHIHCSEWLMISKKMDQTSSSAEDQKILKSPGKKTREIK